MFIVYWFFKTMLLQKGDGENPLYGKQNNEVKNTANLWHFFFNSALIENKQCSGLRKKDFQLFQKVIATLNTGIAVFYALSFISTFIFYL